MSASARPSSVTIVWCIYLIDVFTVVAYFKYYSFDLLVLK